jgi:hypothetical protein
LEESERRERVERAKAHAKLAHRHTAEAHERSALQYEKLAKVAEQGGQTTRAVELRGKAADAQRQGDRHRALGGLPRLGPR